MTSTQQQHPWRTTLRTVVWYVVAILAVIPAAVPIITDQLGPYIGQRVVSSLGWVAGLSAALLGAVQRIVLLTPVATLLDRIGLGTGNMLDDPAVVPAEPAYVPEHAAPDPSELS